MLNLTDLQEKTCRRRIRQLSILLALSVFLIVSVPTFLITNAYQPTFLIDEMFHIPQGIKFIKGEFTEWDPKITTLPGLYIISSIVFNIIAFITGMSIESLCTPFYMRLLNLVFSTWSLYTLYTILTFDDFSSRKILLPRQALFAALNLCFLPVSYFFNFFYYTDTLSTFFVLFMYKHHLQNNFKKSALLGFLSVSIRQTNIIWIGYLMIDLFFKICQKMLIKHKISFNHVFDTIKVLRKLQEKKVLQQYIKQYLKQSRFYFAVCCIFIIFVYWNGGIVLGDRDAHQPVLHLCQMFYFVLFSLFFGFTHFIPLAISFMKCSILHKRIVFISFVLCFLIIYFNTMAHPYLLADNRHYSFYVWKRLFQKHELMKYLLIPVYIFGFFAINSSINIQKRTQFWVCTFLCLVPQKLFEFRYFIPPYLMLRLEMGCTNSWHLAAEFMWFFLLNCITIYLFCNKEFYWQDSNDIQRIIW